MHRVRSSGRKYSAARKPSGNATHRRAVMSHTMGFVTSFFRSLRASMLPAIMRASGVVVLPTALQKLSRMAGSRRPVTSMTTMMAVVMLVGVRNALMLTLASGSNRCCT